MVGNEDALFSNKLSVVHCFPKPTFSFRACTQVTSLEVFKDTCTSFSYLTYLVKQEIFLSMIHTYIAFPFLRKDYTQTACFA